MSVLLLFPNFVMMCCFGQPTCFYCCDELSAHKRNKKHFKNKLFPDDLNISHIFVVVLLMDSKSLSAMKVKYISQRDKLFESM